MLDKIRAMAENILAKRKTPHYQRIERWMQHIRALNSKLPPLPSKPTIPSASMIVSRGKLIYEEAMEALESFGVGVYVNDKKIIPKDCVLRLDRLPDNADLPHIAKELADLSVVNTGTFVEFGICDIPVLEEVDSNNDKKLGPGSYLDENHKLRKPPNHPAADVASCLREQGWATSEVKSDEKEDVPIPRNA